ncbi:MAG: cytochrome P450 [Ktedonobacteraceae bacterium]
MLPTTLSTLQDVQDLYHWFAEMRATQPVWRDESSGCWHVFRYDDVLQVSTDNKCFSSKRPSALMRRPLLNRAFSRDSLIAMDPPQHRQYRNLVSPSFTPRALEPLSGRIRTIVQELLDHVRPNGHMDLIPDLAYPLPTIVIAEMLGVPTSDRPTFKRWADALLSRQLSDAELFNAEEIPVTPAFQQANLVMEEMSTYFEQKLEERRRQPQDDLLSELLAAEVEGTRLTQDELLSFCVLLLLAGHVTTTNLLSQAIRCFDEHPDVLKQLCEQPELMSGAIEEVLRYAAPVWRLTRVTTSEVALSGVTIPADAVVFAWLSSANRDDTQFSNPERFDITRSPNRHIAFGHGIHFCVGAPLARLETAIALPMMLEQLPQLRVDHSTPLEVLNSRVLFGFKQLPVRFSAT